MSSSSGDDVPLAALAGQARNPGAKSNASVDRPASLDLKTADSIAIHKQTIEKKHIPRAGAQNEAVKDEDDSSESEDSDDDVPLSKRIAKIATSIKIKKKSPRKSTTAGRKRAVSSTDSGGKRKRQSSTKGESTIRWNTLEHAGVLFPPEYQAHGVKMLYEGLPVDLTPEQEEVASFFAVMKETDYMNKRIFLDNFWEGFKAVLGPNHRIKSLDKCDFTPIYDWHIAERERKKELAKEEKQRIKEDKDAKEAPYKFALIDGKQEPVGNFRVEPPGLFRGRGEHPKMGMIKKRIYPGDITINIGPDAPIPSHPFGPEHKWREIKHDNTVTWLASWNDPVNTKDFKYVMLAATSTWKTEEDLAKYERARKLKDYIDGIRATYTRNWQSPSLKERQMATALYFVDKLALRAGHEKDEDTADTVGCCNLKCEHVECVPPQTIKFDFLGKDSIRYENSVDVETDVFKNIQKFLKGKKPGDQLFDQMDASDLNERLRDLMDGLSVKVFRTFNASITLDRLLSELVLGPKATVDEKKAAYDRCNKEVAILCNHQRSTPKTHDAAMEKMREKIKDLKKELSAMKKDLKLAKEGNPTSSGKRVAPDVLKARIAKKQEAIAKQEVIAQNREDLKTVALGTSKINYLDPRLTVAWCKANEVPIEKVFNKSLLSKFSWAMEEDSKFRF
jgi:DNA topoisomerase-1